MQNNVKQKRDAEHCRKKTRSTGKKNVAAAAAPVTHATPNINTVFGHYNIWWCLSFGQLAPENFASGLLIVMNS